MPESPEVQALAEFLDARATGRTIEGSELLEARAMKTRARPLATLSGATIRGVRRFGKHVALALGDPGRGVDGRGVDGRHLVVSFGRAGWATWSEPDAADPPADETRGPGPEVAAIARLDLSGGATLGLTDAGDWLSLGLWVVDDPAEVPAIAKLGPDPLDPAFDRAAFDRVLSGRRKQLKALLAEQESVAGIGNAYSDEILHAARLSPVAHASGLAADARERLVEATVGVLRSAADARRGVPPAGQKAAKVAAMGVHGRTGEACPACADTVRDLPGSAGAQYCPTCQTGGVPL